MQLSGFNVRTYITFLRFQKRAFCCKNTKKIFFCLLTFCFWWSFRWKLRFFHSMFWNFFWVTFWLLLWLFKGALSGLIRSLATERPLKMMKNAFYFSSKALFVLKMFKFLSWHFDYGAKQLDKKDIINFKFYDITAWLTNNCNTHIVQYFEK